MGFYQLWEEINNLPQFDTNVLQAIASSVFGECGQRWHGKVSCSFMNRYIGALYYERDRTVEIEFFWEQTPEKISRHNASFTTAAELQPGTIEGIRKFGEFARKLREYKVKIAFYSQGKRLQLYDRVLTGAGYTKSHERFGADDFLYLP